MARIRLRRDEAGDSDPAGRDETRLTLAMNRLRLALKAGYDPNQPRERAGRPTGGRWASGYLNDIDQIVAAAQRFRLAAFCERYAKCVERRLPAGSDFNLWDYQKCLNRCLGR